MIIIDDILNLKNRNLYLEINGKKIPMSMQFYVIDDIFFFNVDLHNDTKVNDINTLRDCLETEALDSCWREDIYQAPMNRIGSCEMRFPKDYFNDVINNDIFDNCYTIVKMDITMDDVIIKLK